MDVSSLLSDAINHHPDVNYGLPDFHDISDSHAALHRCDAGRDVLGPDDESWVHRLAEERIHHTTFADFYAAVLNGCKLSAFLYRGYMKSTSIHQEANVYCNPFRIRAYDDFATSSFRTLSYWRDDGRSVATYGFCSLTGKHRHVLGRVISENPSLDLARDWVTACSKDHPRY